VIRVNTTESRLKACLNRLLQQNRHETDMARCPTWVRCALQSGRRRNGLDQGDARQCAFLCGGNVDRL